MAATAIFALEQFLTFRIFANVRFLSLPLRRRGIVAELAGYTTCRCSFCSLGQGNFKDRHGSPIILLPQLAAHLVSKHRDDHKNREHQAMSRVKTRTASTRQVRKRLR